MKQLEILVDTNYRVLELYRDKEKSILNEIRYLNSTLGNLIPKSKKNNKEIIELFREDLFKIRVNIMLIKQDIRSLKKTL